MIGTIDVLCVVILPLVLSASVVIAAQKMRIHPLYAWPVSLAIAYTVGHVALDWQSKGTGALRAVVMPHIASDWIPIAVILAAIAALFVFAHSVVRWVAPLMGLALAAGLPTGLLWKSVYVQANWSTLEQGLWLAGLAAMFYLVWLQFYLSKNEPAPYLRITLLVLVALGTAVVLMMSGARIYGLFATCATVALFGTVAPTFFGGWSEADVSYGCAVAGGVTTIKLGAMILLGYFYAELDTTNALLLVVALAFSSIWLPRVIDDFPSRRYPMRIALCLVPLIVSITFAARDFAAAMSENAANPYL